MLLAMAAGLALLGIVRALSIDNQLAVVVKHDCYERMAIGQRLVAKDVYKSFNYTTLEECRMACTQQRNACKAFSFGVSVKGNATCELSVNAIKETADLKPIGTVESTDFDLYIKKLGCTLVSGEQNVDRPDRPDTLGNLKPDADSQGYKYAKPDNHYLPLNKPGGQHGDDVGHVQTLVSVASGPDSYLHPVHDILVSQMSGDRPDSPNHGYGRPKPPNLDDAQGYARPKRPNHGYQDDRPGLPNHGYDRPKPSNIDDAQGYARPKPPSHGYQDDRPYFPYDGYDRPKPPNHGYEDDRPGLPNHGYQDDRPEFPNHGYDRPKPPNLDDAQGYPRPKPPSHGYQDDRPEFPHHGYDRPKPPNIDDVQGYPRPKPPSHGYQDDRPDFPNHHGYDRPRPPDHGYQHDRPDLPNDGHDRPKPPNIDDAQGYPRPKPPNNDYQGDKVDFSNHVHDRPKPPNLDDAQGYPRPKPPGHGYLDDRPDLDFPNHGYVRPKPSSDGYRDGGYGRPEDVGLGYGRPYGYGRPRPHWDDCDRRNHQHDGDVDRYDVGRPNDKFASYPVPPRYGSVIPHPDEYTRRPNDYLFLDPPKRPNFTGGAGVGGEEPGKMMVTHSVGYGGEEITSIITELKEGE